MESDRVNLVIPYVHSWTRSRVSGKKHFLSKSEKDFRNMVRMYCLRDSLKRQYPTPFVLQPNNVKLICRFYIASRVRHDVDNLVKSIMDALQNYKTTSGGRTVEVDGIGFENDSQVSEIHARILRQNAPCNLSEITIINLGDNEYEESQI